MSEVCESLINDYIAGTLDMKDLEQGLASIFDAVPHGHTEAQSYLQSLYTSDKIDSNGFTQISHIISKININSTLKNSQETDISYFAEDKTMHLTDISELSAGGDDGEAGDKTVIVRVSAGGNSKEIEISEPSISMGEDESPMSPKIVENPAKTAQYENLGPGVTLKDRFVLLEKLGQGGMGVVFKAKDLLKVEAQDKDPYVAIKVLTDAFKKYSGSFIALQREASKAQRLAHPNIATVYDFDRDGNTVFMTMEYLQGKPLNQLIKEINKKPLKLDHALHIIEELCSGLAYAHEKKLIHSDFKPGNCFLLSDGHVKLLDFGIARASTQTDEERENTMFDPAKLSAVTPAYATPEMFAGMNPDPRDDIYGLACVAYQLLAGGKHPYNKVASPKIKELGIKPKPIKGLNRRQQKTLMKALTTAREDRISNVEKFAEGMRLRKSHSKTILLVALFVGVIGAGIGYKPFLEFQAEQQLYDKIKLIKDGDKALMIETIWSLDQLNPEQQKIISVGLRREIITFYRDRIRSVFRPNEGLYDYPQAQNLLAQAKQHYPDSVALSTIEDQVKEQRDRLMNSLISLYKRYFNAKKLVKTPNGEDLTTVIPLIKRVDPKHYLLKDKALSDLYLSESEKLIAKRKYNEASNYIITGLKLFPEDTRLQSLNKQINAQFQN
ncbi:MAG: serine/threonine protein kinase [Gammaproteobacteria bacterium]|nr:serine/threonine protein kinase [Gammaproteobacteria bacterium]MDH3857527.1 serine/threonine protein kinase [Gammaproteobacteria bacterium]